MTTSNKIKLLLTLPFYFFSANAFADWPVAITEKVTIHSAQGFLDLDVLENDIGDALKVVAVNDWSENGGRVSINEGSPTIRYTTPIDKSVREDGFWYVIEDSDGRTNAARVSVTLLPFDSPLPAPQADNVTTTVNTSIRIDVLSNDLFSPDFLTGRPSNGLLVSTDTQTEKGGAAVITPYPSGDVFFRNYIEYTPAKGFSGTDTFEYVVRNPGGFGSGVNTDEKTGTVTVNVINEEELDIEYPRGTPDVVSYDCSSISCLSPEIDVLSNDSGGDLYIQLNSSFSLRGGEVQLIPRIVGQPYIQYKPSSGFEGEDTVWYILEDELGRQNWSVLTININRPQ